MKTYFAGHKVRLEKFLTQYLHKKSKQQSREYAWATDAYSKLLAFATPGKMIRGGLVSLGYEASGRSAHADATAVGAALELLHSGILIHDDIMDRDLKRRGGDTVFAQYATQAKKRKLPDGYHYGESMGACVGIVSYFVAQEILSEVEDPLVAAELANLCGQEMAVLGLAQMQDVSGGYTPGSFTEADILQLYKHKTGRYTFSLPLMAGAILAGLSDELLAEFENLGNSLGIVYQLQDDLLNIYGKPAETGKPVGSDIREHKQTWLYFTLRKQLTAKERKQLDSIYKNANITAKNIAWVKQMMTQYEVPQAAAELIAKHTAIAQKQINALHVPENVRTILLQLLLYLVERKK
jgi:geranylgeranyl diphosphate synthase type I